MTVEIILPKASNIFRVYTVVLISGFDNGCPIWIPYVIGNTLCTP